jgi:N-acetylmuramoyl-L-alanine amidase
VKFHWLLSSVVGAIGALVVAMPAWAGQLQNWSYDSRNNRLSFTTTAGVQPRAQLIFNPTRVVIDLPGTTLGRPMVNQPVGTEIQEVRVGQFNSQTTRIVIELSPGYVIDPQQVQIQGATPTQWVVQIPEPQRVETAIAPNPSLPSSPINGSTNDATIPVVGAATRLDNVRVTPDGFFMRTTGEVPIVNVGRDEDDDDAIVVELENTVLSPQLLPELPINRYGVQQMRFSQRDGNPPTARVTLELTDPEATWRASASSVGGVVLLPSGGVVASELETFPADLDEVPAPDPAIVGDLATIQAVTLQNGETQLLIQADAPIRYTSQWNRSAGLYEIRISGARLAERVSGPQLSANSPLERLRLRQESPNTVVIQVTPASGTQLGEVNQVTLQTLSLQLDRTNQAIAVPPPINPGTGLPPSSSTPTVNLPQNTDGRVVVVIDPGHGGPDPGAVGIGGLQEKNVIFPIALEVAALLEQQGIIAVLTRQDDRDLGLEPRVDLAEQVNADLFVSIHANAISLSRPDVNGIETYYYSNAGLQLARVLHNSMLSTGMNDRGIRQARFYVLVNTSMPAVLLETGFVTGDQDARLLADPAFRSRMAAAIASGIAQYVQQNY